MADTENFYVLEFESAVFNFRTCDGGGNDNACETFHSITHSITVADTNAIIFAVSGEGADTEFALWFFADHTTGIDECDPSAWPDATYCVAATTTITEANFTGPCSTADKQAWAVPPDDDASKEYPDADQLSFGFTNTSTGSANEASRLCAGDLE
jgi:hypothetical protein